MDGLFYLMSVVGVGVVMWWVMQNDHVAPDQPTKGFFAMLTGRQLANRQGLRGLFATTEERKPRRKSPFDR